MAQQQETALDIRKERAVVSWGGRSVIITFADVKRHICPKANDQEVVVFLKMAQSLNLNPWAREIYLIKWGVDDPASYVIAEESYLKAAEQCKEYDGHEAGIIVKDAAGNLKHEDGAFFVPSNNVELVGGWARIYRSDRKHPFYIAVNFKECAKMTRKGELNKFWDSMPATMIRKVALARALREAFPSRLGGMVTESEYPEMPEGSFPEMLMKSGKPDWPKFYAKIKDELGLTRDQAHKLLNVEHFNNLLSNGWTMESIWDALIRASSTGEIIEGEVKEISDDVAFDELDKETNRSPQLERDPESIKDMNELLRACFDDFGLQPLDVAKELGYSSTQEIDKTPSQCYSEIAVVRKRNGK
jgi:phage recombination protein Bet